MPIGMEEYRTTAQRLEDAHDQIAALEAELSATNIALKASGAGYAALESEIADHKDLTFKSTVALRALEGRCRDLQTDVLRYRHLRDHAGNAIMRKLMALCHHEGWDAAVDEDMQTASETPVNDCGLTGAKE